MFRLSFLVLFFSVTLSYAWQTNGVAICDATNHQYYPTMTTDGSGGAIIAWQDNRNGSDFNIYVQRVDPDGVVQWDSNGIVVCDANSGQFHPVLVSDGAEGAIIAWYDYRLGASDIYAQHVNASGVCQWLPNGVVICDAEDTQEYPQLVSDGAGGAIITWHDKRNDFGGVYVQRVDANGTCSWDSNGVVICELYLGQEYPQIISDGSGGAVLVWHDGRTGVDYDIYAQRVNSSGDTLWQANGVMVCNAINGQMSPMLTPDGTGGAIITWEHNGSSPNLDVKAQRVNTAGFCVWDSNGIMICDATGNQFGPVLISDNSGGALITWWDFRTMSHDDIYAQRIDATGNCVWDSNGVAICDATFHQRYPQITPDGAGGAIITWDDQRFVYHDIYAQRVSSAGACLWDSNGVIICNAAEDQNDPQLIADGFGGAIITWEDERNGLTNTDIFAQRVDSTGSTGIIEANKIASKYLDCRLIACPNPFYEFVTINNTEKVFAIYDISGRLIGRAENGIWRGRDFNNKEAQSGVYFLKAEDTKPVKIVKLR